MKTQFQLIIIIIIIIIIAIIIIILSFAVVFRCNLVMIYPIDDTCGQWPSCLRRFLFCFLTFLLAGPPCWGPEPPVYGIACPQGLEPQCIHLCPVLLLPIVDSDLPTSFYIDPFLLVTLCKQVFTTLFILP